MHINSYGKGGHPGVIRKRRTAAVVHAIIFFLFLHSSIVEVVVTSKRTQDLAITFCTSPIDYRIRRNRNILFFHLHHRLMKAIKGQF